MSNLPKIEKCKVVSFTYQIIDGHGKLFEQSDIPLEYIHGKDNEMFVKVEQALEGKRPGDSVEVTLNPEEGFGQPNSNLCFTDDIENVPPEFRFVGARPTFQNAQGDMIEMVVSKIENGKLTVDGNHPLAGQTVTFKIKVLGLREATEEEIRTNRPNSPPPVFQ